MSNIHGFDFLKTEHTLENDHSTAATISSEPLSSSQPPTPTSSSLQQHAFSNHDRTDAEKVYDVIKFLESHRNKGCLNPNVIYRSIHVDLSEGGVDKAVRERLLNNPKIRCEEVPDPENPALTIYTFGYQTKFKNVFNKVGLLAQINRSRYGVARVDLEDAYEQAKGDLDELITAGDILVVARENKNKNDHMILFPRGEPFLVELDGNINFQIDPSDGITSTSTGNNNGNVKEESTKATTTALKQDQQKLQLSGTITPKPYLVDTDVNPKIQIRRGEAIWIGGQWFRISSAIKEGVSLDEQPERAKAPPSVTLRKDLPNRNSSEGYIRPFTLNKIPLDHDLLSKSIQNIQSAKELRGKIHKAAMNSRGAMGDAVSTLISSNANSLNPQSSETLSKVLKSFKGSGKRHRPTAARNHKMSNNGNSSNASHKAVTDQIEEVKKAATNPDLIYSHARRHGCTGDVRSMYLETKNQLPSSGGDGTEIYKQMVEFGLLDRNEKFRREPMVKKKDNLDEDGRPKKKRYYERKGQRITNTHLENSHLGAFLRAAADKSNKGESVGDGGM